MDIKNLKRAVEIEEDLAGLATIEDLFTQLDINVFSNLENSARVPDRLQDYFTNGLNKLVNIKRNELENEIEGL